MGEPNVAARLKLFVLILFVTGFVFLIGAVPLTVFNLWNIAVPLLVFGGTLLFVGVLLSLFFHSWIDEVLKEKKVRKEK